MLILLVHILFHTSEKKDEGDGEEEEKLKEWEEEKRYTKKDKE
jgi:hypothetical protein